MSFSPCQYLYTYILYFIAPARTFHTTLNTGNGSKLPYLTFEPNENTPTISPLSPGFLAHIFSGIKQIFFYTTMRRFCLFVF